MQNGEGAPAHLKSFTVDLCLMSDVRVRDAAAQFDERNMMDLTGSQSSRGQGAALNSQRQCNCNYCSGQ